MLSKSLPLLVLTSLILSACQSTPLMQAPLRPATLNAQRTNTPNMNPSSESRLLDRFEGKLQKGETGQLAAMPLYARSILGRSHGQSSVSRRVHVGTGPNAQVHHGEARLGRDGIVYFENRGYQSETQYFPFASFSADPSRLANGEPIKFTLSQGVHLEVDWSNRLNPMDDVDYISVVIENPNLKPVTKPASAFF